MRDLRLRKNQGAPANGFVRLNWTLKAKRKPRETRDREPRAGRCSSLSLSQPTHVTEVGPPQGERAGPLHKEPQKVSVWTKRQVGLTGQRRQCSALKGEVFSRKRRVRPTLK